MKILNIYKSIGVVALAATLLVSCSELEFDIPVESEVALTNGSADFSNYVAIGASFSAGVSDGTLFRESQNNSFPNSLASVFAVIPARESSWPVVTDEDHMSYILSGALTPRSSRPLCTTCFVAVHSNKRAV